MTEKIVFIVFILSFSLTWLSSIGYILILRTAAFFIRKTLPELSQEPPIAFVIPTLNEENLILPKIRDLKQSDYPRNKIFVSIVDGGSVDGTRDRISPAFLREEKLQILHLPGTRKKVEQILHVLQNVKQDYIVFSDADSRLTPSCIRELINVLVQQPKTAVVGAMIQPDTPLVEEKIHWWFLNDLWNLEGEVFKSSGVSGVCYAVNRKLLLGLHISSEAKAEDIHIGLEASSHGRHSRTCRRAVAVELRVPQTIDEFMSFRNRRGATYLHELSSFPLPPSPPQHWRFARFMRIWQFRSLPWLALISLISGIWIFTIPFTAAIVSAAVIGIFSMAAFLAPWIFKDTGKIKWPALLLGILRYPFILLLSLVTLKYFHPEQGALGGKNSC